MTSMTDTPATASTGADTVIAGVDTHGQTHHAAVLDECGRELADHEFAATPSGYAAMLSWLRGHGHQVARNSSCRTDWPAYYAPRTYRYSTPARGSRSSARPWRSSCATHDCAGRRNQMRAVRPAAATAGGRPGPTEAPAVWEVMAERESQENPTIAPPTPPGSAPRTCASACPQRPAPAQPAPSQDVPVTPGSAGIGDCTGASLTVRRERADDGRLRRAVGHAIGARLVSRP